MKRLIENVFVVLLSLLVVFSLASCQSSSDSGDLAEISVASADEMPSQPMLPPPPSDVEAEIPVSVSAEYLGYSLNVESYDGYAVISYPADIITDDDIDAFIAQESAKYGLSDDLSYMIADGSVRITYPEGIGENTRRAYASMLITDVIKTVDALFPEYSGSKATFTFTHGDYELKAIFSGRILDVSYPDILTAAELEGFIGALNFEYGDTLGGVFYEISAPGIARCTFIKNAGIAEAGAFISILTTALVSYML